jgi:hypothetical protein
MVLACMCKHKTGIVTVHQQSCTKNVTVEHRTACTGNREDKEFIAGSHGGGAGAGGSIYITAHELQVCVYDRLARAQMPRDHDPRWSVWPRICLFVTYVGLSCKVDLCGGCTMDRSDHECVCEQMCDKAYFRWMCGKQGHSD